MRKTLHLGAAILFLLLTSTLSFAHFGMVIPAKNIVDQTNKEVDLQLSFSHPFELIGMDLIKPEKFYVVGNGEKRDLLPNLKETKVMQHAAWQTTEKIKRPGVYQYVMEPTPYWEPAEDLYIIHYTKTIVAAFGAEEGWEEPVGLPTEIVPLLRPFGNYAGNTFVGQVLINGKPAGNASVEVELYNAEKRYHSPTDYHITQVILTDTNGVFTFTCPVSGWWGFSALHEAGYTIKGPNKSDKNVELGAVLWIYFDKMQ